MERRKARRSRREGPSGERSAVETVKEYIARINAGDAARLAELAAADLRFIDATGSEFTLGKEDWEAYFSAFPDYRIEVEEIFSRGGSVAAFGSARGSFQGRGESVPGASWHFPAAWRAQVRAGKLVEWQVYGDVEPMLQSAGQGRSSRPTP